MGQTHYPAISVNQLSRPALRHLGQLDLGKCRRRACRSTLLYPPPQRGQTDAVPSGKLALRKTRFIKPLCPTVALLDIGTRTAFKQKDLLHTRHYARHGSTCQMHPGGRLLLNDNLFRPPLRRLLDNLKIAAQASSLLSFIGVPEDLRLVVEKAPAPRKELFQDRWAYSVVTALLSPSTEKEWSFLRSCALNEYDDLWVDAGAIQTLKLIASPKSRAILEQIPTKNPDRSDEAKAAVDYINAKPAPLSDRSLTNVAERVAKAVKIGSWKGNKPPTFNSSSDKALVQCEFRTGRDLLVYTATFHKVGEAWVLRGVRETMQALLAEDADSDESGKK